MSWPVSAVDLQALGQAMVANSAGALTAAHVAYDELSLSAPLPRIVRDLAQDDGGFPSTQHHGGAVGVEDVEADAVVVVAGHGVEVTYEEFDGAHRGGGGEAAVLGHEVPSGVDSRVGAGS